LQNAPKGKGNKGLLMHILLFATTHLKSIEAKDNFFYLLYEKGFFPEVYFGSGWDTMNKYKHMELAKIVLGELGGSAVHLPYKKLYPGENNPNTIEAFKRATEIANYYKPDHLIGHAIFKPLKDSILAPTKSFSMGPKELAGEISTPNDRYLEVSQKTWQGVLAETDANLFLENTSERTPYPIIRVLETLNHPRAAMCLDVGHWHYSGMGSVWHNLDDWIEMIGPKLGHLHLHDNDGDYDQHRPMGQGDIDFMLLKELLTATGRPFPSATVENHDYEDLLESYKYLREHFELDAHLP
jgi:sugar phosphate isomerase/epimerase